jgi:hypothetical protein
MTIAGAAASLASLALHFTSQGDDEFGCATETLMMSGSMNTNKFCTREMAACSFLPKYLKGSDRSNASIACNETVRIAFSYSLPQSLIQSQIVVKWLQLILAVNALIVLALFSIQARKRRQTRVLDIEPVPKATTTA